MQDYVLYASAILTKAGYKKTSSRLAILDILASTKKPISPYNVVEQSSKKLDVVTVYRFFELLHDLHLVQKIHSLQGYIPTDGGNHDHIHYFVVCPLCQHCEEKHVDSADPVFMTLGAYPSHHSLEIVGTCHGCIKK